MSISSTQKIQPLKEKFFSGRHFKDMAISNITRVTMDAPKFLLIFYTIVTALGELGGRRFSFYWYFFGLMFISLYIFKLIIENKNKL
jgi:hypothetical protein